MIRTMLALIFALNGGLAFAAAKIQGSDVKSLSQVTAAGGSVLSLIPDSKIVVTANSINQQLSTAITSGLLGGGGTINLVGNPSFEAGGTSGWSTFSTTIANAFPTTAPAACGTCSIVLTSDTSTPLRQATSLRVTASSTWQVNQGFISTAFTVPPAYRGRTLSLQNLYSVISGSANLTLSGQNTGTLAMYVYDVTNSQWLPVAGAFNFVQGTLVAPFNATVSLGATTASVQVAVVAINTSAGAVAMDFDDMSLGPQLTSSGVAMTDWAPYTAVIGAVTTAPTYGTVAANVHLWRRVGDTMEIYWQFQTSSAGSAGSGTYRFPLPSGYTIDNTKFAAASGTVQAVGIARVAGGGASAANNIGQVYCIDSTDLALQVNLGSGGIVAVGSGTGDLSASAIYAFVAHVPIVNWTSGVAQSADQDVRPVSFYANAGTNAGITTTNTTLTWSAATDSHNAFNGSTSYTVPVTGQYLVNMTGIPQTPASGSTAGTANWALFKNGSQIVGQSSQYGSTFCGNSNFCSPVPLLFAGVFKSGDVLTITFNQNGGTAPLNLSSSTWSIIRLGGNAVVQATDPVAINYSTTTSTSVSASTNTLIPMAVKLDDSTAGAWSGNTFTAPSPGRYQVNVRITTNGMALTTAQFVQGFIYKNGSYVSGQQINGTGGSGNAYTVQVNDVVRLNTGDTIAAYLQSSVATTINPAVGFTTISIARVSN